MGCPFSVSIADWIWEVRGDMAKSPMERTLNQLREWGIEYDIAQSYNAHSRRRKDLFKIVDVVGLKKYPIKDKVKALFIQVCGADWSPHIKKMLASPYAPLLVEAGELWLIGWTKNSKGVWKSRVRKFKRGDYPKSSFHSPLISQAEIKPPQTFDL